MKLVTRLTPLLLLFSTGCKDVEEGDHHGHSHDHEHEVITTVQLSFAPQGGGTALDFTWADPENDSNPVVDDIALTDGQDYAVTVEFHNELEDPAEDVTPDILELAEEHQIFFTGSAVDGPATGPNPDAILTHSYTDSDANGLPLGLENTIVTRNTGTGELTVTLRHLPPENGEPTKTDGMAQDVATAGFSNIPGDIAWHISATPARQILV